MSMIKHIWFDFSDTIGVSDKELHSALKHGTFSRLRGAEVTSELREEYARLFEKHGSNSNLFAKEFDVPKGFWAGVVSEHGANGMFKLIDPETPEILEKLAKIVPISIFSNVDTSAILTSIGVDINHFTHITSSAGLTNPKPHPEGFERIIKLSGLPAEKILFIGDNDKKEMIPANSVGLQTGMMWKDSDEATHGFKNFKEILAFINSQNI